METSVVQGFAALFAGGKIARDDPTENHFRPWENPAGGHYDAKGEAFVKAVEGHLKDPMEPIGVYPIYEVYLDNEYVVDWGCIDWDDGEKDALVYARNTQEVLRQLGITGWIERSRSKGYHLWVFCAEPIPAVVVREALIAACEVVDSPIKEVNPKQTSLPPGGLGNGVRLPYAAGRAEGRNTVVTIEDDEVVDLPVEQFVKQAIDTRTTAEQWDTLRDFYTPPVSPTYQTRITDGELRGLAKVIRENGPRPSPDKPNGDRSATLFAFACAMVEQGYDEASVHQQLADADYAWGSKFGGRADGPRQLREMVASAIRRVAPRGTGS